MRRIDEGPAPQDCTGQALRFENYRDAARWLKERIGRYCSYCERTVPTSLAAEHKLPKVSHPELQATWGNLLLACSNCNSNKHAKVFKAGSVIWPDEHDTFGSIDYEPSGAVRPAAHLPAPDHDRVRNLLALLGLDKEPTRVGSSDHRWFDRLEAWRKASQSCVDIAANDSPQLRRAVIDTARSTGAFSVWMAAFASDRPMREELVRCFPGSMLRGE